MSYVLTLGRNWKIGPTQSRRTNRIAQDTREAIWVTPPVTCWIKDLDKLAEKGMQAKNDPKRLLTPMAKNSWLESTS